MYISKVYINNYRSFKGLHEFNAFKGCNIIIGKNGVGKTEFSKIFKSLEISNLTSYIGTHGRTQFRVFSFQLSDLEVLNILKEDPTNLGKIMESTFENSELKLDINPVLEKFLQLPINFFIHLNQKVIIIGPYLFINSNITRTLNSDKLKNLGKNPNFSNNYFNLIEKIGSDKQVNKFFQNIYINENLNLVDKIDKFQEMLNKQSNYLNDTLLNQIRDFFSKIRFFNEIRLKPDPQYTFSETSFEIDGRSLADHFLKYFTSQDLKKRKHFEKISSAFSDFFPYMKLIPSKGKSGPKLLVNILDINDVPSEDCVFPVEEIGTGFLEFLIFFANIFEKSDQLFIIEELETHLHTNLQRKLIKYIQNSPNQFIIISHSPNLITIDNIAKNSLFRRENGKSRIIQPQKSKFLMEHIEKFKNIFKYEQPENKELFFADKAIIVEGPTEKICLPFIAEKMGIDLDLANIFLINAGSKYNIKYYHRLLQEYKIPHIIVIDLDDLTPEETDEKILGEKFDGTIYLKPNFEEPLKAKFPLIFKEMKAKFRKKPIVAFETLQEITKNGNIDAIPEIYIEIINSIKK